MASGVELAQAFVTIIPSMQGSQSAITDAIVPGAGKAGDAGGKTMGSRFGKFLAKSTKAGVIAIGTAAVAGAGLMVKKGFDRALDIEDAKSTLKSLGYEAQAVQGITDDVLASVRGTPFAMNEAMSAGVSALAAGVKQGEALTGYLTTVGDAATVAKVPFDAMAGVFSKVQATGKVTGRELQQLGQMGIPILQWLADEYGVTAEEMTKMVSSEEVDAARFQKSIADNVAGAAQNAGETTRGAWDNMFAALGRAGAGFVEGILPQVKGGIAGITGALDAAAPSIAAIGEKVGAALSDVVSAFGDVIAMIQGGEEPLNAIAIAVAETFGVDISGFTDGIKTVVDVIVGAAKAFGTFAGFLAENPALLRTLIPLVTALAVGFKAFAVISTVLPIITGIIGGLSTFFSLLSAGAGILGALTAMFPALGVVITIATGPIGLIIAAVAALIAIGVLLYKNWDTIKEWLGGVWESIKTAAVNAFNGIVAFFRKWGPTILAALGGPIGLLVKFVIDNWDKIRAGAVEKFTALVTWVKGVPGKILAALGSLGSILRNAGRAIMDGFFNGLKASWKKVTDFIGGIAKWIRDNKGPKAVDLALLVPAGGWIMTGLMRGIEAEIPALRATLGRVTDSIQVGGSSAYSAGVAASPAGGINLTFNGPINLASDADYKQTMERFGRDVTSQLRALGVVGP